MADATRDSKKGTIGTLGIPRDSKKGMIGTLGIPRDSKNGMIGTLGIPQREGWGSLDPQKGLIGSPRIGI